MGITCYFDMGITCYLFETVRDGDEGCCPAYSSSTVYYSWSVTLKGYIALTTETATVYRSTIITLRRNNNFAEE